MDDTSETRANVVLVIVSPASGIIIAISYNRRHGENRRWK